MKESQKRRLGEVIRFVITGGVCFLIEQAVLSLLKELFQLDVNFGTPIAFLVSVIANYLLCVKWVFPNADGRGSKTKLGFVLTSSIGFFLNWGIMALLTLWLGQDTVLLTIFGIQLKIYHVNKTIATLLVMVWNYFTKRYVLKSK
jgi:putative flippase GtrA